jgi:glycosyltransferase involved in cell wall biosynthesis
MRDFFEADYDITNIWDESWGDEKQEDFRQLENFDVIFCFQKLVSPLKLALLGKPIIWAPMYGDVPLDTLYWKSICYLNIKVISFSAETSKLCEKFGIKFIPVKYFLNPENYKRFRKPVIDGVHVFFWYRGPIKFEDIKKILPAEKVDGFTYRSNPDPKYRAETLSEENIKNYKIKIISEGYKSHDDYLEMLSNSNVFIAPRKKEGIGMTLLEAMALGQCPLVYDAPTMNEYITDHVNGLLFGDKLELSKVRELGGEALRTAYSGFADWQRKIPDIIEFSKRDSHKRTSLLNIVSFSIFISIYHAVNLVKSSVYKFRRP